MKQCYGTVYGGMVGHDIGKLVGIEVGNKVTIALKNYAKSHGIKLDDPNEATDLGAEIGQSFGDYLGKIFTHVKSNDGESLGALIGHVRFPEFFSLKTIHIYLKSKLALSWDGLLAMPSVKLTRLLWTPILRIYSPIPFLETGRLLTKTVKFFNKVQVM